MIWRHVTPSDGSLLSPISPQCFSSTRPPTYLDLIYPRVNKMKNRTTASDTAEKKSESLELKKKFKIIFKSQEICWIIQNVADNDSDLAEIRCSFLCHLHSFLQIALTLDMNRRISCLYCSYSSVRAGSINQGMFSVRVISIKDKTFVVVLL